MPVIRVSDRTIQRLQAWAEPLKDTADSALSKALDAAEGNRDAGSPARTDGAVGPHVDAFVEHLLAMPEVGEDGDFERDATPPRDVALRAISSTRTSCRSCANPGT